jgi:dienelactone hydrolase
MTLLDGYLFRPEGNGPFPAIVALHGCSGLISKRGKLNARFLDWGRLLAGPWVMLFFSLTALIRAKYQRHVRGRTGADFLRIEKDPEMQMVHRSGSKHNLL